MRLAFILCGYSLGPKDCFNGIGKFARLEQRIAFGFEGFGGGVGHCTWA